MARKNSLLDMFNRTLRREDNDMGETKSRYEVIAELESKKMQLIYDKNNFDSKLKRMQVDLRDAKREVEDKEEAIKDFESKIEEAKVTNTELIASIDDSLKRFAKLNEKQ